MATVFSSDFFHCLNLVQPDPEGLNGGKRKKNGKKINRTGRALSNRTMEAVLAPLNPTSAHYSLRASPKDARPAGAARFPHIHRRLIHFPKHKSNREWRGGEGGERHRGCGAGNGTPGRAGRRALTCGGCAGLRGRGWRERGSAAAGPQGGRRRRRRRRDGEGRDALPPLRPPPPGWSQVRPRGPPPAPPQLPELRGGDERSYLE